MPTHFQPAPFKRVKRIKRVKRAALGAATLLGLSSTAFAQSNVSLYGVVDVGVRHVRNGDASVTSLASNGNNTSRLGLRGTEDLGDGLRASFVLESGLSPDTGAQSDATRFWNRRSTVSLSGGFGELRLGRDYSVTYLGYEDYDVWSDIGISSVGKFDTSLGTNRDTSVRADNQIAYFTPPLGGFYGRVALAPGEGASGKKYGGARLGYAAGPLDVSATYGETRVAPVGGSDNFKTWDIGAAYDFGPVKLSSYVTGSRFASARVRNAYLGAQIPVGSSGLVRASYLRSDQSGTTATGASIDANDANQFALGYLHSMSKRTALYANVARVSNHAQSAVAVDKNPVLLAGGTSTGVDVGLRHSF